MSPPPPATTEWVTAVPFVGDPPWESHGKKLRLGPAIGVVPAASRLRAPSTASRGPPRFGGPPSRLSPPTRSGPHPHGGGTLGRPPGPSPHLPRPDGRRKPRGPSSRPPRHGTGRRGVTSPRVGPGAPPGGGRPRSEARGPRE